MLLAVIGFTACDSDSIEDLQGTFSDITFCNFNHASVQPTTKLGKGVKALNTQFTDANGNTLSLSFGSKEWILGEGSFSPVTTVSNAGTYAGTVNGSAISEGNVAECTLQIFDRVAVASCEADNGQQHDDISKSFHIVLFLMF